MPCVKIALRQKAERTDGRTGKMGWLVMAQRRGRLIGRGVSDRKSERPPKMVWTKSAGGDKRLAGRRDERVSQSRGSTGEETNLPFLQWKAQEWRRRRRRVVFWRDGTASRRLRLALGNARLTLTFVTPWRGGIEYFIMANDRFINSNLSAIKSRPPSIHPSSHEGPNNAPIIGQSGGAGRSNATVGERRTEAESASETNKRWADRSGIGNERADDGRQIPRKGERKEGGGRAR